jgi:hypothetical protein
MPTYSLFAPCGNDHAPMSYDASPNIVQAIQNAYDTDKKHGFENYYVIHDDTFSEVGVVVITEKYIGAFAKVILFEDGEYFVIAL